MGACDVGLDFPVTFITFDSKLPPANELIEIILINNKVQNIDNNFFMS